MPSGDGRNNVSQKWLLGLLTTLVLGAGTGWMTYVHGQLNAVSADQKIQRDRDAETKRETAVIKEKVERLEGDVRGIRGEQKEQSKKLDELLRRVR